MSQDDWTSSARSLFTQNSPPEPQQSPPPPRPVRSFLPRASSRGKNEGSLQTARTADTSSAGSPFPDESANDSKATPSSSRQMHARRTSSHSSTPNRDTGDDGGSPFRSMSDCRGSHRSAVRQGSAQGLPAFARGGNNMAFVSSGGEAVPPMRERAGMDNGRSGLSSTFVSKVGYSQTMKPPPLSVAAIGELDVPESPKDAAPTREAQVGRKVRTVSRRKEPARADAASPRGRDEPATLPHVDTWPSPLQPSQPHSSPAGPALDEAAEADKLFRRIGYSLITEALRLGGSQQQWFAVRPLQHHADTRSRHKSACDLTQGDCRLEYTYLATPGVAHSPRGHSLSNTAPPASSRPNGNTDSSLVDIPLYRATVHAQCTLETLGAVLAQPDAASHYIFNADFHRVVALYDGGRGCLQHTGFVTQPPTDVVGFHYMRLMSPDKEFAKASASPLSTRLSEALEAFLHSCTSTEHAHPPAPQSRRSRPKEAPRRVLVCSSTSVDNPLVPLQWGYTRCRIHLSAIIAFENEPDASGRHVPSVTLQLLFAQDPRDQKEGAPGPTGADHSIPAMLAQRAQNLRAYCHAQHHQFARPGANRGRRLSARFIPSSELVEHHEQRDATITALFSGNGSGATPHAPPRRLSSMAYYKAVWSRIRDMESERAERQMGQRNSSAPLRKDRCDTCQQPHSKAKGDPAVMTSSSPEPRPPWQRTSEPPASRATDLYPFEPGNPSACDFEVATAPAATSPLMEPIPIALAKLQASQAGKHPRHQQQQQKQRHPHTATIDIDNFSEIPIVTGRDDMSVQQPTATNTRRVPPAAISPQSGRDGLAAESPSIVREPAFGERGAVAEGGASKDTALAAAAVGPMFARPSHSRHHHDHPERHSSEPFEREEHLPDSFPRVTRREVYRMHRPNVRWPRARTTDVRPRPTEGQLRARTTEAKPRRTRSPRLRAVRVEVVSCDGLPETPFRQACSSSEPRQGILFHVSLRTHPGDVRDRTSSVPYATRVVFPSPSEKRQTPITTTRGCLIPVTGKGSLLPDVMTVTAVARNAGDAAVPLLRIGEADVFLGNLRAGQPQTLDVRLVGRAATGRAKERATVRCVLTPVLCGVPPEKLLTLSEEEEVRHRYLSVMRAHCPEKLHRLECFVGEARAMRRAEALRAVEALACSCHRMSPHESLPAQAQPASQAARSRPATDTTSRTNSPLQSVFSRRPVHKTSPTWTATSSRPFSTGSRSRSGTGSRSAKAVPPPATRGTTEDVTLAPPPPPPAASGTTRTVKPRSATQHPPPPLPPGAAAPREKNPAQAAPVSRARKAYLHAHPRARTTPAPPPDTELPRPPPTAAFPATVTLHHFSLKHLMHMACRPDGLSFPPLLHDQNTLFVEVEVVSRERGKKLPSIAPVVTTSLCGYAGEADRGGNRVIRFGEDVLTMDVSWCSSTGLEPALLLTIWLGRPECRIGVIGCCQVSLRVEREGEAHDVTKTLPLVANAGTDTATPCGLISFRVRCGHHCREEMVARAADDPIQRRDSDELLRQRLTTYLWAHARRDIDKVDVVLDKVRSAGPRGGLTQYIRSTKRLPEPNGATCKVQLLRWMPTAPSSDSPASAGSEEAPSLKAMSAVIPCVSLGYHHRTLPSVAVDGQSQEAVTLNVGCSIAGVVATSDEMDVVLFARCPVPSEDPLLVAPRSTDGSCCRIVEVGRIVLPVSCLSGRGTAPQQIIVPLVHRAGTHRAAFRGAVELQVSVDGRDFSGAPPLAGFDEHWRPRERVARALTNTAAHELHRLFVILASFEEGPLDARVAEFVREHGEDIEGCGPFAVELVGFQEAQPLDGTTISVKGYSNGVSFLRTGKVLLRTNADGDSIPTLKWKGTTGTLTHVTDVEHHTLTFRVAKSRPPRADESLCAVQVSLAGLCSRKQREKLVWVPLYGDGSGCPVFLGLMGVKVALELPHSGGEARRGSATAASQGRTLSAFEPIAPNGHRGEAREHAMSDDICGQRDIASLFQVFAPHRLSQIHPTFAQAADPSAAHALARQAFAITPDEACFTLFLHMADLHLSVSEVLPPAFTSRKATEHLFVSAFLGPRWVGCRRCCVDGNGESEPSSRSTRLSFRACDPASGCLRVDIAASFVTQAHAQGAAPALTLVLHHGTVVRTHARDRQRQRQARPSSVPSRGWSSAGATASAPASFPPDARKRSLSEFISKRHPKCLSSGEKAEACESAFVSREGSQATPSLAMAGTVPMSMGGNGPFPSQLVEASRAELSLRGLAHTAAAAAAAAGGRSEAVRVPFVVSTRTWRHRITVLESGTFRRALASMRQKWQGGDGAFVLGDLPVSVSLPHCERAVPSWLSLPRTTMRADAELVDLAREAIVSHGQPCLLSRVHYDTFETYAEAAHSRDDWHTAVVQCMWDIAAVGAESARASGTGWESSQFTPVSGRSRGNHHNHARTRQGDGGAQEERGDDPDVTVEEDLPDGLPAVDGESVREAQRAQQRVLHQRKEASAASAGRNPSISFWTSANDDADTVYLSDTSSLAADPRTDASEIMPANTKRALF